MDGDRESAIDEYLKYMSYEFVHQQEDQRENTYLKLEGITFDSVSMDKFSFQMNFTSHLLVSQGVK